MKKLTFKQFLEEAKASKTREDAPNDGSGPDADGHPAEGCHGCDYHEADKDYWRGKKKKK